MEDGANSKVKLGKRISVAIPTGLALGFLFWMLSYFIATAINTTAGTTVINPTGISLGAFGLGFALPTSVALSKDLDY